VARSLRFCDDRFGLSAPAAQDRSDSPTPRETPVPRFLTPALLAAILFACTERHAARAADPPPSGPSAPAAIPADFAAFQHDVAPLVLAARPVDARHWRQIEPAVHHLALQHADRLTALAAGDRVAALAALAGFIDASREAAAATPVLAPDRAVIGLLDPARGLEPREITTIATAYGSEPVVFKQNGPAETIAGVAADFLAAVERLAADPRGGTIIVLGHGLPTEIQSYGIRFERLAAALCAGAARAGQGGAIDLGRIVIVCDDCFSADFLINLCGEIEARCRDRGAPLASLPACIAGTNRACVGHADVGELFVPHFWRDVIELCYVRRPRPATVTLRDFFDRVDGMMYGYGRAPVFDGGQVTGWRIVDPAQVQDPVVLVPLDDAALATLRTILGLPADAPLPRWLDVG
jgi:hypothetical protein